MIIILLAVIGVLILLLLAQWKRNSDLKRTIQLKDDYISEMHQLKGVKGEHL